MSLVLVGMMNFVPESMATNSPVGAYELFTRASSRVMGMGGTFAALSDDATACVFNPAGTALAQWRVDGGAATDQISNTEYPTKNSSASYPYAYEQPFSYTAYAAAARIGPAVVGASYSNPYEYVYDSTSNYGSTYGSTAHLTVSSIDAMLAWRFGDSFAIGVAEHFQTLTDQLVQNGVTVVAKGTANPVSVGVVFRKKNYGIGAVYNQGATYSVDSANNASFTYTTWFRDVVEPSILVLGGFYRLSEHFLFAVDLDQYSIPSGTVDASSGLSAAYTGSDVALNTGTQQVWHGGVEWTLANEKNFDVIFRAGGYQEPARLVLGVARLHGTLGLQVRFGLAVLNVSFDQADGFNSTSQGFSLVFDAI